PLGACGGDHLRSRLRQAGPRSEAVDVRQAPPSPGASTEIRWHFGSFVAWETQRRLERSGQPVRLGPRTLDLLLPLLKRSGAFVSKEELLATVWAGVVVEDISVRVHMSTLRKTLGKPDEGDECEAWISSVPQQGYRFNGRVRREVLETSTRIQPRAAALAFTKL